MCMMLLKLLPVRNDKTRFANETQRGSLGIIFVNLFYETGRLEHLQ